MKKILFVFAACAIGFFVINLNSCTSSTSSNAIVHTWTPAQSGVTATLISVRFSTLKVGTAVGVGGVIVRTTDGGTTWVSQTSGSTSDLYSVSFSDVDHGIAVGSYGTVISTANGGATWTPLFVDVDVQFRNVLMTGQTTAYAIGTRYFDVDNTTGYIYKTTDGGATWKQLSITSPGLYGISFIDSQNGWVSGFQGVIFKTTNGGTTWTAENSNTTATQVAQLSFADATHGIAVGYPGVAGVPGNPTSGFILTTSDGGATWTKTSEPNGMDGVWMADREHAMAVGWNGTMMETSDGGATWTTKSLGSLRLLNVFLNDANDGATVGENGQVFILGSH